MLSVVSESGPRIERTVLLYTQHSNIADGNVNVTRLFISSGIFTVRLLSFITHQQNQSEDNFRFIPNQLSHSLFMLSKWTRNHLNDIYKTSCWELLHGNNVIKRRQQDIVFYSRSPPTLSLALCLSCLLTSSLSHSLSFEAWSSAGRAKERFTWIAVCSNINWQPYVVVACSRFHVMHLNSTTIR